MKSRVERRLEDALAGIFEDLERDRRQVELRQVRRDPKAHRLTRLMAPGKRLSYRYADGGLDATGRQVWFCWSVHRNAAGYFLSWKELRGQKGGERVGWSAHEKKSAARARAERWCRDWKGQSTRTIR